ncbi:MAG: TlpA family protein disulfide reductase [Bacteroidetes bacterium]|nr:TlpA family protein disulfide reductase [Bacteroidota bacterium]
MKSALHILTIVLICISTLSYSQQKPQIIYKDASGKVLSEQEVDRITKGTYSMSEQKQKNGDKIIVLAPMTQADIENIQAEKTAYANSQIGKLFPSFSAETLDGNLFDTDAQKGKIQVYNFWFIACKPCVAEMPILNKLAASFDSNQVVFIAPAFDKKTAISKFLESQAFDYQIVPDALKFTQALHINSYPTHIVVNQKGVITAVFVGNSDDIGTLLEKEITALLKS